MEINLTVEQEAQFSHIAALEGKDADELAREVLLRGLNAEATLIASRSQNTQGQEAAVRLLELRQGNMLPEGVTIQRLIREGRARRPTVSVPSAAVLPFLDIPTAIYGVVLFSQTVDGPARGESEQIVVDSG